MRQRVGAEYDGVVRQQRMHDVTETRTAAGVVHLVPDRAATRRTSYTTTRCWSGARLLYLGLEPVGLESVTPPRLPSQTRDIALLWLVPNYTVR